MSNVAVFCRRFRALMQAWYKHPVRTFCQDVSQGEVSVEVPSDSTAEASDDDTVASDSCIDVSHDSEADPAGEIVRRINALSAATKLGRISATVLGRIADHRAAHGPFQRPEDLMGVAGVGRQTLQRIQAEILRPTLRVEVGGARPSQGAEHVGILPSRIESLKDIVAVDIGLKHLGWVHMTRDRRVWQWKIKDLVGLSAGKWDPPAYQQVITNTISEMPQPDLFVLEHQPFTAANKSTFQTLLFQRTLQGMLYATLNADFTGTPRAISLLQARVGRHFDLQVRGMRASGQEIVAGFLRDAEVAIEGGADVPARVDYEGAAVFRSATRHQREHLANCLLQAVAFYDLIVDRKG